MQDSIRREAKIQNKAYSDHKKRELENRDFNKNIVLNKNLNGGDLVSKSRDSFMHEGKNMKGDVEIDPILTTDGHR